jgi:hypothetical protein
MKKDNLYLPSNGTEGDGFMSIWCENCKKDTMLRGGETQCSILTNALVKGYVKQWVYIDNVPICTSFVKVGTIQKHKKRIAKNQIIIGDL